jgi:F-type H+-transporting ATPase subunit b
VILILPLLAAAEGGGGGLTDINFGLTLWTIVLFGLFAFVLGKFGWGPLLAIIEEREKTIHDAVEGAERASAEAQALLQKHKEMVQAAGREREEIIKSALKEAERLKADLAAKARAESEQMIEKAKAEIAREKSQALLELRKGVADLAMEAASKIVTSSLTPEAQRKLVNDFVASLPRTQ